MCKFMCQTYSYKNLVGTYAIYFFSCIYIAATIKVNLVLVVINNHISNKISLFLFKGEYFVVVKYQVFYLHQLKIINESVHKLLYLENKNDIKKSK